jgi:outer membrane lipopolysaccharide assembly protein LptE/RlpB
MPEPLLLKRNHSTADFCCVKASNATSRRFRIPSHSFCSLLLACCLLLLSMGCGYHVAGKGDRLPPDVKTIAVPIFVNQSSRFRIEQMVSEAVTREFIERTSYRITPNPQEADAVLHGTVKDVRAGVVTFDLTTGRATTMQIQVTADVKLVDTHSHKTLFSNSNYIFREQYQISPSESGLFEEDQPALRRLSQDLARTLVTAILENF